ncbi:MAG TPA: hypothetical protein VJL10_06235 [Anaerolineales bacterium]|nr:hypothetical protein [Anaerolineales bacterium]
MVFSSDLVTGLLSFLFTILIFSYLIGDNPLFRIAVYIFVGVSSGYLAALTWWQVIVPRLIYPLVYGSVLEKAFTAIPLLGAVLILMKISPRLAGLARIAMAFLVGAGAAVIIAGALSGTLLPQIAATINAFDLSAASARNISVVEVVFNGAFILAGTVFTLIYFHFGASPKADGSIRRLRLIEISASVGRIFIGITLGTIFAGVYAAALTALIERISALINFIGNY